MTHGAIFLTEGFDESQFVYAKYRLREDGIVPEVATPSGGTVEGESGMTVSDTLGSDYGDESDILDFVIVPASPALRDVPAETRTWLRSHLDAAPVFACLGDGVALLVAIDGVSGRLVTGPDDLRPEIDGAGGAYTGDRVTVDGNLVTGENTSALPFFVAAVRNTLAIPQDPDATVRNRPFQERAAWSRDRSNS